MWCNDLICDEKVWFLLVSCVERSTNIEIAWCVQDGYLNRFREFATVLGISAQVNQQNF